MPFRDLREYVERLEQCDELIRIKKEVDWDLEAGGIARRALELKMQSPLFEKIKGYREGKILGCQNGPSRKNLYARVSLALDLPVDSSATDLVQEYLNRKKSPVKPVIVSTGECKENIQTGDEIDLFKFPVPKIHEGDGGRYIGTWHSVVTKDPDSDWVNWGMYRLMVHDKKSMGGVLVPPQHIGRMYYQKYEPRGIPMEFAAIIGAEPIVPLIGCTAIPAGVNEVDIAGALRKEPIELVKCETIDMHVPATSEIVIEGEVLPNERKSEGPFGEYVGYRASEESPKPVYRVKCITHRNNPILPMCALGNPIDDCHLVSSITYSAELMEEFQKKEFPVKMVYVPPQATLHMVIISSKIPYPNFAKRLANLVWTSGVGLWSFYVVVVNEDIDPTNLDEVLWAITTRCHPDRGISKQINSPTYPILMPFLPLEDRLAGDNSANVIVDATWPHKWPEKDIPVTASFDTLWPKAIQEKVKTNWKEYGYKD